MFSPDPATYMTITGWLVVGLLMAGVIRVIRWYARTNREYDQELAARQGAEEIAATTRRAYEEQKAEFIASCAQMEEMLAMMKRTNVAADGGANVKRYSAQTILDCENQLATSRPLLAQIRAAEQIREQMRAERRDDDRLRSDKQERDEAERPQREHYERMNRKLTKEKWDKAFRWLGK
jgi:hypothetical protein